MHIRAISESMSPSLEGRYKEGWKGGRDLEVSGVTPNRATFIQEEVSASRDEAFCKTWMEAEYSGM